MRAIDIQAHFRNKKTAVLVRGMSNRHSDIYRSSEEAAPFVKGALIALLPALLCWAGIIEAALKFWREFSH